MSGAARNVVCHLRERAEAHPEKAALIAAGETVTFGGLWDRVCRVSHGLARRGLEPGDRVIVMVPMSVPLYVTLLAVIKMGGVAVFVDPWMGMQQIAAFAAFAEPKGFIGIPRSHLLRLLNRALLRLPVTVTTGASFLGLPARYSLANLADSSPLPDVFVPPSPGNPALITFTSGSSGVPKGANRTHGFLDAQYRTLSAEFPYAPGDVDMPMFPVFSLRNLAGGTTTVIPEMDFRNVAGVDGARLLRQMGEHGVTTFTASPPFVDRVVDALAGGAVGPPLRRIISGGAPISDETLRRWRGALPGTAVEVAYGSTEAEPVAKLSLEERLEVAGAQPGFCMGRPVPEVTAKLIRVHKGPVAFTSWEELEPDAGGTGELVVTGDHVCRDYFRNPEAAGENKLTDADGRVWHRMGDTGSFDDRGCFWLAGRVHSTILRDGFPLHAQLVEQQAQAVCGGAVRVAALGVEHETLGEALWIVVEGDAGEPETLREAMSTRGIPVDRVVRLEGKMPTDPRHNTKIEYGKLRAMLGGGR